MKKLFSLLFLLFSSVLWAQLPNAPFSGTITASGCITVPVGNRGTVNFQVTGGTWTGTIQPQAVINGNSAVNIQVTPLNGTTAQSTITANGVYSTTVAGFDSFKLCGNTVTNTATVKGNSAQFVARNVGNGSPPVTPSSLAGLFSCQILDTAICTAATTSGNPTFLSGSGATITVNGSVTPLVYFVGGVQQTINSALTVTASTPGADTVYYIYAKQDTTNPNPVSADLFASNLTPIFDYTTAATCGGTSSATNLGVFFDLALNVTKTCTSNGAAFTTATPMILLGVAIITSAPATRAVLCEPYRLNNYRRVAWFQNSVVQAALLITGTSTITGMTVYRNFSIDGGTVKNNSPSSIGTIIYSLTPVIITNSGTFGIAGDGGAFGGAGAAAGNGSNAQLNGGLGGTGGGGGGAEAVRSGGNGGSQQIPARNNATNNGATGGTATNVGGTGQAAFDGFDYLSSTSQISFGDLAGAPGGGGGGNGSGTGGNGGNAGSAHVLIAPSILIDTGCTVTSSGGNGAAGTGTNSGGGGGGGGSLLYLAGGFIINNGTASAAGGSGGNKAGGGGNGGPGGAGAAFLVKLW